MPKTTTLRRESPGIHPAFPVSAKGFIDSEWNGLTKREYMAATLLAGLLTQRRTTRRFKSLAATAVKHADDLLQQLQDAPV